MWCLIKPELLPRCRAVVRRLRDEGGTCRAVVRRLRDEGGTCRAVVRRLRDEGGRETSDEMPDGVANVPVKRVIQNSTEQFYE